MSTRRNRLVPTLAFALIAVATTMSDTSFAKDDAREAALRKAESARFEANVSADAKVLGELLSDDLEYTHSNGDFDTKASFIESLTTGKRDYVKSDITLQSVRIFGDIAVIRGKATVTVADNGQSRDLDLRYLDVWKWRNGKWQMISWQSARMPPAAAK